MSAQASVPPTAQSWRTLVAKYEKPDLRRSVWQLVNSFVPFFVLWYLAYRALSVSVVLALALSVLTGGFMMRLFIILHDCGHGSLFASKRANDFWGVVSGFFTFTPYYQWRHEHAIHHASAGDLDRRGVGDVWVLTVREYLAAPKRTQAGYRVYRHPLVMFTLGPLYIFLITHRLVGAQSGPRERNSVYYTNLVLLALVAGLCWLAGVQAFLLVTFPALWVASAAGVWMFYVQHQFENTYWERHARWDYWRSAIQGASFYKLPRVLQFFSGNIGYHHVHHLSPRIPNYNLQACHENEPVFKPIVPLTLRTSLKCATLRLWDEERKRLVPFADVRVPG